ncbi:Uncharacterised protein [Streptococcus pneumoniae]|nr:Uncharacterised protein [Streptococcus pneumoniae]
MIALVINNKGVDAPSVFLCHPPSFVDTFHQAVFSLLVQNGEYDYMLLHLSIDAFLGGYLDKSLGLFRFQGLPSMFLYPLENLQFVVLLLKMGLNQYLKYHLNFRLLIDRICIPLFLQKRRGDFLIR